MEIPAPSQWMLAQLLRLVNILREGKSAFPETQFLEDMGFRF
jgi:hypothetical protein